MVSGRRLSRIQSSSVSPARTVAGPICWIECGLEAPLLLGQTLLLPPGLLLLLLPQLLGRVNLAHTVGSREDRGWAKCRSRTWGVCVTAGSAPGLGLWEKIFLQAVCVCVCSVLCTFAGSALLEPADSVAVWAASAAATVAVSNNTPFLSRKINLAHTRLQLLYEATRAQHQGVLHERSSCVCPPAPAVSLQK